MKSKNAILIITVVGIIILLGLLCALGILICKKDDDTKEKPTKKITMVATETDTTVETK